MYLHSIEAQFDRVAKSKELLMQMDALVEKVANVGMTEHRENTRTSWNDEAVEAYLQAEVNIENAILTESRNINAIVSEINLESEKLKKAELANQLLGLNRLYV